MTGPEQGTEASPGSTTGDEPVVEPVETNEDESVVEPDETTEGVSTDEGGSADESNETEQALAERTADLQRLQAEYANYRRRVERDREQVRENATYTALTPIVEVLDTIDRAREHGELEGGFKAVADQLERIVTDRGLVRFGAVGDEFDPTVHEALSHIGTDPGVRVTTCKVVAKAGYKIGDRVVRAAQVLVVDPEEPARESAEETAQEPAEEVVENE